MQTLRKRSSPCKYKNEPSRFLGEGMTFKAKLIGILEVNEARGDKMCQDALNDLKTAIRAAGEHKQRITISIAIDGLRLRDEKSGDCLYHHPVHKISFIAQDMSDSRAFGYIFGSPDTGHRFFGIKTDKTASQVVISMRDLFQVVFELKKKEIEMAKHHIEQRQIKYGTTGNAESMHSLKDDYEAEKGKGRYPQLMKMRCMTSKTTESSAAGAKSNPSEAIADLLDLEHELNSIQQGINQMDRITPSDPFGPLSKGDPFLDPFEDSFASKIDPDMKVPPPVSTKAAPAKSRSASQGCSIESPTELEKQSTIFGASSSAKSSFFSQFSPTGKPEEPHWFDQETESLFNDRTNVSNTEPTSSPITFPAHAERLDSDQATEDKKSPIKPDVFMELDPLGSGWVKPYVDKKDFFQDLKNPPKKVLKELLTEHSSSENSHGLLSQLENNKSPQTSNSTPNKELSSSRATATTLSGFPSAKEGSNGGRYSKIDPFDDTDPFEKADPFYGKSFGNSVELPSIFSEKSFDGVFPEATAFDKSAKEDELTSPNIFPSSLHGPLRVSLPPEKADTNTPISLSSLTSKFRSSPSPPEESKTLRRRNYQVLKQCAEDRGEDTPRSPVHDEFFCSNRSPKISSSYSPKTQVKAFNKEKAFPAQKINKFWNEEFVESSPDPPPKPKAALFSIKPPPLPPKKQNQPRPPARPPSLEDAGGHYDYLRNQEAKEQKSPGRKPKSILPLLPPPPQRKTTEVKSQSDGKAKEGTGSVFNITLNQLDNTGLENLAVTLGIPSDHIYNMTLQELTQRLSVKYLNASVSKQAEPFKADFESNFGKMEHINSAPPYDKYAVFKELIENDNKTISGGEVPEDVKNDRETEEPSTSKQEEDRYAALRQLSMNPQKSENLSEELDLSVEEDSSNKVDNSDNIRPKTEDSFTPMNSVELVTDSPVVKSSNDWSGEAFGDKTEEPEIDVITTENEVLKTEEAESGDNLVFPKETKAPEEKVEVARDNWATFDKVSIYEAPIRGEGDNDNSPFSSDGKEDSFSWRKKTQKQRGRNDVPWRDEDESWDDYSPKESYWSDESSHDDRSLEERREGRYQRRTWSKQIRKSKGMNEQWCRRPKWDDTEDEYEESWKNHRCRMGACDMDRKGEGCPLNSYDWCNNRSEPWQENDRYLRCYGERRKKSETDDEYRRRCDSDTSDREYVWTSFKRSFPEGYGRSEKQKYHMLPYTSRDCPERCHEPRSKQRKGESHKRPSSASEGKRNYEKMYSGDHPKVKRPPEEEQSYRDFRYCCTEPTHHYSSYDRRLQTYQSKKPIRNRRTEDEQSQYDSKPDSFEYYKSTWHKQDEGRSNRNFQFEDDFAPVTLEKSQPKQQSPKRDSSRSPRRKPREDWTGHKDGIFRSDNNNDDNFGENAPEDLAPKQQILGKNHFAVLTRQESSTSLRKSESINIFSRENDPFEGDDFFSSTPSTSHKLNRFAAEKSKSNSNVSDAFTWKEVFGESSFHD
ncbi:UNVERIFIED_CONTAM: hypothetical protein PYX00_000935 [Menopon gallinae]|uniref:PID domain-containing protein n=1 Tax=Menopon gallinae TaxID=328185 RepID=A0AAW2IC79_9NEOP